MAESSDVILNRMLGKIDSDYDTSGGSFFYDLNTPMSIELSSAYDIADQIIERRNVETSTGDDLTEVCSEMGVDRELATYSTGTVLVKGRVGAPINSGDLVASDLVTFQFMESTVMPASGSCMVKVQATILGSGGDVPANAIKSFPKTLTGLTEVTNPDPTTGGYNRESDDSLKARYYVKVRTPSTSANKGQYIEWANEVQGTGGAKVVPLWNGRGTVKVIIVNEDKRQADQVLVNKTYDYIESVRPICSGTLTVVSATEKALAITASISVPGNATVNDIQAKFNDLVADYLKSIVFNATYVSSAQIGNLLLSAGALDYANLTINGVASNVALGNEEIAVIGTLTLGVI